MYEHEILYLGFVKRKKIKDILDKKSKEGWEIITIVPDININQQGIIETKMAAVLKRNVKNQNNDKKCCCQHND